MNAQRLSYIGQHVSVGVDVHKGPSTVTCVCNKQIVKTATVPADPAGLAASLPRWFHGATLSSVYEAGFSAFVLHRALTTAGMTNIVVNPASVAVAANEKVKTDRRDAKKLAMDLADGRLRGIYVPPEAEELARLLPRTRAQIVEHRATIARQIKAKLHQFGLMAPACRRLISNRYVREIETWALPPALRVRLTGVAAQWRFATRQLMALRRLRREPATAQEGIEKVYRSVPGIGEVGARTVATALGDMTRFANERALFSDTGLRPRESSSGTAVRRGHIRRQGSSRVRRLLVETAWRALPRDEVLQEMFDRIAATRGKKRAMVALARRLSGRLRACFRQGTTYAVGTYAEARAYHWQDLLPLGSRGHAAPPPGERLQTAVSTIQRKERKDGVSALHGSRPSRSGMNSVTTATSLSSLCRQHCQHVRKCAAQEVSWSRTNKQLEAWLRLRPRITGGSAEKLAIIGGHPRARFSTQRTVQKAV
jgi:transposase